ncbi:MAG: hypothetical protein U0K71_00615 [Paludibacteraceae bacterium]|nr:hypothetical protein [Paludibacteraceae bacterium]
MKKIFVSALTVLNLLYASAQEEKMDVTFTPVNESTEVESNVKSEPVETKAVATEETKSFESKPATQTVAQQTPTQQPDKTPTSSNSDDFDADFFASNNEEARLDGDIKNVLGLRFGACTSKATSYGVSSAHMYGFTCGVVDQIWFGEKAVFSEIGLFCNEKGYSLKNFEPSQNKLCYLEIPALMCYRQGRESLNVTYKAGGYLACAVHAKLKTKISDSPAAIDLFKSEHEFDLLKEGAIKRFDAGVKFGVDFVVRKVQIGFTYDLGLYKIDKKDIIYGDDTIELGYKQLKNRSFQILAGFNFK